jgi:hypothetical protein
VVIADRVRRAIEQYRRDRRPDALIAACLRALIATAVLAFVLLALRWLALALDNRLTARLERQLHDLGVESLQEGTARRAGGVLRGTLRALRAVVLLVALFVYLDFVLRLFPWTRPIHTRVGGWFVDPLRIIGEGILAAVPDLIFLVILGLLLRWTIGLIRLFFKELEPQSE